MSKSRNELLRHIIQEDIPLLRDQVIQIIKAEKDGM